MCGVVDGGFSILGYAYQIRKSRRTIRKIYIAHLYMLGRGVVVVWFGLVGALALGFALGTRVLSRNSGRAGRGHDDLLQ